MCGHHQRSSLDLAASPGTTLVRARPGERVTDSDREHVVDQLRLHVGQGRLSLEEFSERVDRVLQAVTGADLAAELRDLPRLRTAAELRTHRRSVVLPYLLVSTMLVLIWAVTGFGFPWPVFPLLGWGVPVLSAWYGLRKAEVGLQG